MYDKIISRIMLLPLIIVAPMLSPIAGLVWWVCLVFGVKGTTTGSISVVPIVMSTRDKGRVFVGVWFLTMGYELFSLKYYENV